MESIRESKTVKILEEIGADPNLNNDDGRTPLSWAAALHLEPTNRILSQNGADIDFKGNHGRTSLN